MKFNSPIPAVQRRGKEVSNAVAEDYGNDAWGGWSGIPARWT